MGTQCLLTMTRGKRPAQANFYSRKKQKTSSQLHNKQSVEEEDQPSVIDSSKSGRNTEQEEKGDDHHSLRLVSLPHLVLVKIADNLSVSDLSRLSCVNKYLRHFINSNYILRVSLTGPGTSALPSTSSEPETSATLYVLSLDLRLSVSQLPTDLFTYQPFSRLNLRKLKNLRVTGQNHIWNKQYLLSDVYKRTIERLLSQTSYSRHLTKLEFLVDESRRSVDIVKLARHFPNLVEVVLHGIGYFSGSYHMDKDVAQNIITGILCNTRIKILRLKSFATLHRCIVIESDTLEELQAEFGKHFEVGLLYLPNVLHISLETSVWAGCFYHAQNGELKKIVAQGCPRLKTFNSLDLRELSARSESQHWLGELGQYCATQSLQHQVAQCVLCVSRDEQLPTNQ